jgi:hypothetical protein
MVKNMEHDSVGEKESKEAIHPSADALPKVGLPLDFIHVPHPSPVSHATPTPVKAAVTKDAPSVSTAHLLSEYMHYFAPQPANMQPSASLPAYDERRSSARTVWWIGGIVSCLLLGNIITMLMQRPEAHKEEVAVIEFENTPNPVSSAIPINPQAKEDEPVDYATPSLNVPRRRVLVISEETRKELLEQLKEGQEQENQQMQERLEYYRK